MINPVETTEIQLTPKHRIGYHNPVFIVAEVGSNWKTFDDCIHSIKMAQVCGADAVKFQAFTPEALYGIDYDPAVGALSEPAGRIPRADVLPLEWLPKLKTHADACGIEFMCSAFSPELVSAVDPFVNIHKVASSELSHVRILEKLATTKKPVFLSTGASGDEDIKMALAALRDTPVCLLYCIAAYPARSIRLEHIDHLRSSFSRLVGFSDHSLDIFTHAAEAIFQHKACVIEKHFNAIDGLLSADSSHSLNVHDFKLLVTRCRNNVALAPRQSAEEHPMFVRHNRRLIATKDLAPGDVLEEGKNFGIYRSLKDETHAFSPFLIDDIRGKAVKVTIKAGDGIGPGDI